MLATYSTYQSYGTIEQLTQSDFAAETLTVLTYQYGTIIMTRIL